MNKQKQPNLQKIIIKLKKKNDNNNATYWLEGFTSICHTGPETSKYK